LSQRPFRIAVYPAGVTEWDNPYFRLCHAALARRGITVKDDLQMDRRWLESHAAEVDAVHVHWPEYVWRSGHFGRLGRVSRAVVALRRLLHLRSVLRAARRLGMQRIWTLHNLEPHEGSYRWDRYGYQLVAREADVLVCHSRSALEEARRRYQPGGRTVVMPIGECASEYPPARPRTDVLRELGLDPSLPVVSCLGRLRGYKGLDLACAAIDRLRGRVQLIIGGPRHADFDVAPIAEAARPGSGIVFVEQALSAQAYSDLMGASDAVLLPYRAITGSAVLLSALASGRGVIASDLPFFREILSGAPDAGVLVPGRDPGTWADRIVEYLAVPAAARSTAALRLAGQYSWDRCVEPLVAALRASARPDVATESNPIHA
jgi:glycosyltransferase involved in cell wall biosynthesis